MKQAMTVEPVAAVRAILTAPDHSLDQLRAKLALDAIVDPATDAPRIRATLDRLAEAARALAGAEPDDIAVLDAVRRTLYERGPWNEYRPFSYDFTDRLGVRMRGKLLGPYLESRRGQCLSMPALFPLLAERLGLELRLATAPHHAFLRDTPAGRRPLNIEATSGGLPARDDWYRRNYPMSDLALVRGLSVGFTVIGALGAGSTGSVGYFNNLRTDTRGYFYSYGATAGAELDLAVGFPGASPPHRYCNRPRGGQSRQLFPHHDRTVLVHDRTLIWADMRWCWPARSC